VLVLGTWYRISSLHVRRRFQSETPARPIIVYSGTRSIVTKRSCSHSTVLVSMVFVWQGVKRRFPECNAILLVVLVLVVQGISTSVDVISHSGRRLGHADAAAASKRELIAGGVAADPERYPFFALTANDAYDSTRDNVCGAVLIHPDILLTAAHCHGFFNYGVRMYDSRSQKYDQRRRIVEQWRHPNFNLNNDNLNWDVMVMRLEEPVYDIAPVPLNSNANVPARNEILLSAGFGATTYLGDLTNILMEGEFQYMMPDVCANRISTFKITGATNGNELLCTGSTSAENSICLGDSGGPLLTQDGVLVGIASWTVRCESDQIPDGFARVSTMYNWIEERICEISAEKPLTCPESPTIPTNEMVEMWLQFRYDFSPEDTTFAVRNRQTRSIEYAGPTYVVPDRVIDSAWISNFFLPEGGYAFEVYDKQDNGLSETDLGAQRGFWELYARHQDGTKDFSLVASGGHSFTESSTTNFQIVAAPTQSPTTSPTFSPTLSPTKSPTFSPTLSPTLSIAPSGIPATQAPSSVPTATPTGMPSLSPTNTPTTATPTGMPSLFPTNTPRPINRPTGKSRLILSM
jgi:trypsin